MKKTQAFIFDMDGLLFDTETLGITASIAVGKEVGYPITREMTLRVIGVTRATSEQIYREYFPDFDMNILSPAFARWMRAYVEKNGIPLKPGAREILAYAKTSGRRLALASSSPADIVEFYLKKAELTDAFDAIISGGMAKKSKPAPDIFLLAADSVGVAPAQSMVFEDSVNGIKAGRAAGMRVCMVPDLIPYSDALAPYVDLLCPSLTDALAQIQREDVERGAI